MMLAMMIRVVITRALRGSPFSVRRDSHRPFGSTACSPMAMRIRAAPTTEASAEENVAPSRPAMTAGPQAARSTMIV